MGVSPTGEQVTVAGMEINHVRDGKIVESWSISDALGMMRQLGAVS
jgi:predicted ester cyclase